MQFNDCKHNKFSGLPQSVGSTDVFERVVTLDGEPQVFRGTGQGIDASVLEVVMPLGDLAPAPMGVELDDLGGLLGSPTMGGPLPATLDSYETEVADLDGIASSALALFERRVATFKDVSIFNFLIELRDVRSMVLDLQRLARWQKWSQLVEKERLNVKDISFDVSNSYLSWKFGYCPLMRDIITILKSLANLQKKVKRLLAEVHKPRTVKAHVNQYKVAPVAGLQAYATYHEALCDGMYNYSTPTSLVEMDCSEEWAPDVGMRYSLFCEPLCQFQLKIRMFLETFDVAWDPVIVWNAIPFSFILDWIWDISGWLERIGRKSTLPVELRVMDFYIQWKYKSSFLVKVEHANYVHDFETHEADPNKPSYTSRYNIACDRFRRVKFMPDKRHLRSAKWDENVIDKTLLGAALARTTRERKPPPLHNRFGPWRRTVGEIFRQLNVPGFARNFRNV
jgi:hypothetical protein